MKICHVISGYHRTDARVFVRQCGSLAQAGYDVALLTNDGLADEIVNKVAIIGTGQSWPRWRTLAFAKSQFERQLRQIDADIYQLHSPELLPTVKMLKKMNKRVIYDAHEDMPAHILEKEWIPKIIRKPLSKLVHWYMNRIYRHLDGLISPHDHVVERALDEVGIGVVVANFPKVRSEGSPVNFKDDDCRSAFCYTGTVYDYSNQEITISVIQKLQHVTYEVAGIISTNHLQRLRERVGLQSCTFHGHVPHDELQKIYQRSIAGLAIYDYKLNLGWNRGSYATNKIFEYMEAGIPIVCTDYILWKDIVDRYQCGFAVPPRDPQRLRQALEYLVQHPEVAREMGANGRKAVEKQFNWRSEEAKYLEMISGLTREEQQHA